MNDEKKRETYVQSLIVQLDHMSMGVAVNRQSHSR
jgi:hypothetical protein